MSRGAASGTAPRLDAAQPSLLARRRRVVIDDPGADAEQAERQCHEPEAVRTGDRKAAAGRRGVHGLAGLRPRPPPPGETVVVVVRDDPPWWSWNRRAWSWTSSTTTWSTTWWTSTSRSVGGTSHPETQNTLNLVSAPIDPSAWTVSLTCQPCCGVRLDALQRVGEVVGLGGVEAVLAAAARVVVLADEHRVGEERLDLARRLDGLEGHVGEQVQAFIEAVEVDLELAAHVRLVVGMIVELHPVDLDRAVVARRVCLGPRRAGGADDRGKSDAADHRQRRAKHVSSHRSFPQLPEPAHSHGAVRHARHRRERPQGDTREEDL